MPEEKSDMELEKAFDLTIEQPNPPEACSAWNATREARLVRRIDLRLIPASVFFYLLCFLDLANIGNAKILNASVNDDLEQTIDISDQQYLIALMVFIVSYTISKIPSGYMLKRVGPSRWFAFLMLGSGICTMSLGAVKNFAGLVVVRFLLAVFEAGIFPGIIYCLTFWYKPNERALRAAIVLGGATLAGAFGGALAFGVGHIDRALNLQAWKWLFIIEGAPSCLCPLWAFFLFPNFPETSRWLSNDEREMAVARVQGVASLGHAKMTWHDARSTLVDWRLYLHYLTSILFNCAFSSISYFLPTIVSGLGFEGLSAQLFTVPPYAIAFVVMMFVAWQADKRGIRSWSALFCFVVSGVSFIAQGALPTHAFKARYALLCVAVPFTIAINPPQLSWLTANISNTGMMTLALPLNQSFGQLGQLMGIYTYKPSEAPGYPTGHFANAGFLLSGAIVTLVLRRIYTHRNSSHCSGEPKWQL